MVGRRVEGIGIYDRDEFEEGGGKEGVKMGVLRVGMNIGEDIREKMVGGGIEGVWKFRGLGMGVGERIVVENR